jgi:hypothetical protein
MIASAFASVLQDAPHACRCHPWLSERDAARMETRTASETRRPTHAPLGTPGGTNASAACTFAWRAGSFEAVSVYVDPVPEGLSVSIHEEPRDDPSAGLVAISFTLG